MKRKVWWRHRDDNGTGISYAYTAIDVVHKSVSPAIRSCEEQVACGDRVSQRRW